MPIQISSNFNYSPIQEQSADLSPIIGIDLGTTNSLVAVVQKGIPHIIQTAQGESTIPSVISFSKNQLQIGRIAKNQKVLNSQNTVFSIKRLIGRSFKDIQNILHTIPYPVVESEGLLKVKFDDQEYTPIEISALILGELKKVAEDYLKCSVSRAVITVPAYFNDDQRQATRIAGRLAGLDVLRMVNEPTAASLAYGLDQKNQGLIAVFDLGGGTFDLSILKLHDGIFEVLSTHGNTALGGDDFDQALVQFTLQDLLRTWNKDYSQDNLVIASLIDLAEKVKIDLSSKNESCLKIEIEGKTYSKIWNQEEFKSLILPILEKTRSSCLQAIQDAGLKISDLSDVILVGGPTRLQVVQDFVKDVFEKIPNTSVHPDQVVALGAAIQADILAGNNQDILLLDIVPLSLGIETYGGIMSPLISRNTRIPAVSRETFTTFVENQTGVDIHVLQGEREKVQDNRSLARFKLSGIQPMPAGLPRIEVTFLIDADGVLQVSAKDLRTRLEQSIEVKPTYGLTDEQVERMLLSGVENQEKDSHYRKLIEARNEAEIVLKATEKSLPEAKLLLEKQNLTLEEYNEIDYQCTQLKNALQGENIQQIKDSLRALNQCTTHLAEIILQKTLQAGF